MFSPSSGILNSEAVGAEAGETRGASCLGGAADTGVGAVSTGTPGEGAAVFSAFGFAGAQSIFHGER